MNQDDDQRLEAFKSMLDSLHWCHAIPRPSSRSTPSSLDNIFGRSFCWDPRCENHWRAYIYARIEINPLTGVVAPSQSQIVDYESMPTTISNVNLLPRAVAMEIRFKRGSCKEILRQHHKELRLDPDHLSTKFINDLIGCNCSRRKKKS